MCIRDRYRIVQRNALSSFKDRVAFDQKIKADPQLAELLTDDDYNTVFNSDKYSKHVDFIFDRVYKKGN